MKIPYKHILEHLSSKPGINEVSDKLFQLGHEHEINKGIFDMEFTPNRGDCLSLNGLLRDLKLFYDVNLNHDKYEHEISSFNFDFVNNAKRKCPQIAFLKIEIENEIDEYKGPLQSYFLDLNLNKNNFFTDVSNFVLYETGQPTHCYDAIKIDDTVSLEYMKCNNKFKTLLNKKIVLEGENLVFLKGKQIINLAGIVGDESTSCSESTKSVIVECAYFNPEVIIGKSVKYDIQSEAAYKFERGVDPKCHEKVLRRFISIVDDHAIIKNVEIFSQNSEIYNDISIPYDLKLVNRILGFKISDQEFTNHLNNLGFYIKDRMIYVPSYRRDIRSQNDIAEEIARAIGYDNISVSELKIPKNTLKKSNNKEYKIKSLLIDNGFYEVINNPFEGKSNNNAIKVDNPLDSNREFLRTNLKQSLINNLIYNERRQKDSIKLFEVSDVYSFSKSIDKKKIIGIIASGRIGKNYINFGKKINNDYISNIFQKFISHEHLKFETISRESINSKIKNEIIYLEFELDLIQSSIFKYEELSSIPSKFIKYKKISEYPFSARDLSFSISDYSECTNLEKVISNFEHELLKEAFIFDYYENKELQVIKIAYRFIFQSDNKTITDIEVNKIMNDIIKLSLDIKSINIPGLKE